MTFTWPHSLDLIITRDSLGHWYVVVRGTWNNVSLGHASIKAFLSCLLPARVKCWRFSLCSYRIIIPTIKRLGLLSTPLLSTSFYDSYRVGRTANNEPQQQNNRRRPPHPPRRLLARVLYRNANRIFDPTLFSHMNTFTHQTTIR